jgi:hypothetical protein
MDEFDQSEPPTSIAISTIYSGFECSNSHVFKHHLNQMHPQTANMEALKAARKKEVESLGWSYEGTFLKDSDVIWLCPRCNKRR